MSVKSKTPKRQSTFGACSVLKRVSVQSQTPTKQGTFGPYSLIERVSVQSKTPTNQGTFEAQKKNPLLKRVPVESKLLKAWYFRGMSGPQKSVSAE